MREWVLQNAIESTSKVCSWIINTTSEQEKERYTHKRTDNWTRQTDRQKRKKPTSIEVGKGKWSRVSCSLEWVKLRKKRGYTELNQLAQLIWAMACRPGKNGDGKGRQLNLFDWLWRQFSGKQLERLHDGSLVVECTVAAASQPNKASLECKWSFEFNAPESPKTFLCFCGQ